MDLINSLKIWLKSFPLNSHSPVTGFALMVLALTQLPAGIKMQIKLFVFDKLQI
tara:strand:+ start:81 stop:242 length:162 start_codon:yes stop_codon:yes gene_type:complete